MIFVTVGTSFPFDRLIRLVERAVEEGILTDEVFAQVGAGGYRSPRFECVESLEKNEFDRIFSRSAAVISHAGMGTISMACEKEKPVLVLPRLKACKELVNNHQLQTARRFVELGHVLAAYGEADFLEKCSQLPGFIPRPRSASPRQTAERIAVFLEALCGKERRPADAR